MLVKVDKNANPVKKHFNKPKHLLHYVIFFHQIIVNVKDAINCNTIIIDTKIININPVFFILSTDQSFKIFPRHNGVATISRSFALN